MRSSARSRFSRFWLVATTTVGNGGRLGGVVARCLPAPFCLLAAGGFAGGVCTTTVAAVSTARPFFFAGGRL
jgi:hypothetical protein